MNEPIHPCGLGEDHTDACLVCRRRRRLGWAHTCRYCWEKLNHEPNEAAS